MVRDVLSHSELFRTNFRLAFGGLMKRILIALTVTYFSAMAARAQSEVQELPLPKTELSQISLLQVESQRQPPNRILPDNPIPVLPSLQDGPDPCPFGNGKSCALLGGRAYFSDPMHMTEHDQTFWKAATNPGMLVAYTLNLAATAADMEGTEACLHTHSCREANPLLGPKPGRARAYGTAVPVALVNYAAAALLKKHGKGNLAFALLWCTTVLHSALAVQGFANVNH